MLDMKRAFKLTADQPARRWFVLFRFYGPEREYYNRSWKLPDFENGK
jgi:hypothetical protein